MPSIDLNCDLGESFGAYTIGMGRGIALCKLCQHCLRFSCG